MINTERLLLRGFEPRDWRDLHEYLSDAEVVKYEPYHPFTEEQSKREAIHRSGDESFWAVCLKDRMKMIGNVYLSKRDLDTWELGYVFNMHFQGKGYATEAAKALVDYAFSFCRARRIVAMCNPLNESSWRLLERLKFRREGHLIQNTYFKYDENGQPLWADTYEYGLLASEWSQYQFPPLDVR